MNSFSSILEEIPLSLSGYLWYFETTRFNIKTLLGQKTKSNKNHVETRLLLKVP